MLLLTVILILFANLEIMLQSAIAQVLPTMTIVPMLTLVMLMILTIRSNIKFRQIVIYAVSFGILFAVMYADTALIYIVAYTVPVLIARIMLKVMSHNAVTAWLAVSLGIFFAQVIVYLAYYFQGTVELLPFLGYQLVPTVLFNMASVSICYPLTELILKTYKLSHDNQML